VTLQSIARATCHIYKEHREDLINMKMAPANVAGEEGRAGSCSLSASGAARSTRTSSSISSITNSAEAQKTLKVPGPRGADCRLLRVLRGLTPAQQAEIIARTEERMG